MGWAAGFNAGTRMGRTWIDTYNQAKDEQEFKRIQDEKPQVSQGFTAEQGDQLNAIANSGQYNLGIQYKPDGTFDRYTAAPKSEPNNVGHVAPQQVTDFFGERTAGAMSPRQVEGVRSRQMAGAVSRRNPLMGARMMREQDQADRDQARFDREGVTHGLQVKGMERAERNASDEEGFNQSFGAKFQQYMANPESMGPAMAGINLNHAQVTIDDTPNKDGSYDIRMVRSDGRVAKASLNPYQLAESAALIETLQAYPSRAPQVLQRLSLINKDIAETVARDNNLSMDIFKARETQNYHRGMVRASNRQADAAMMRANTDAENAKLGRMGAPIMGTDAQGNGMATVPVLGRNGVNFQQVPLPAGFRIPRQVLAPKDALEMAQSLVGQPHPDLPERKMTLPDAMAYVQQAYGGGGAPGGTELNLSGLQRGGRQPQTDPGPQAPAQPSWFQRAGSALVAKPGETGDFGIQDMFDYLGIGQGYQGPQTGFRNVPR